MINDSCDPITLKLNTIPLAGADNCIISGKRYGDLVSTIKIVGC